MSESDGFVDGYFIPADEEHIRREKAKAKALRASQSWKNELGKGVCYYCKKRIPPRELTMDHIVPIVRGGFTRRGNVVPCCKECNNRKKYLLPVEWQEYLDRLKRPAASSTPSTSPVPPAEEQTERDNT